MWLVTELLGFDDQRGAQGPVMGRSTQSLSGRRKLPSELIGREVAVRELSRVLTFEASQSSPLSLHKLSSTYTTQLFE